ncbi:PA2778 family cysteine peptidase [Ramlibacter sp. G-1-2-2]|uniref:PA2778 family cysteine peptidase n=1 Tax=Ramlibacter agri TaxID=2728837 RepID=A0A848H6L9_9BURK|nr:PA2778 family cysteine peptidase [Ramlibacter agri]NML44960.1 PA2778 family cysteine peptidase [Ramlibacter agri]
MQANPFVLRTARRLLPGLAALVLAGCAQLVPQTVGLRTGWPAGVPQSVELSQVPFFPQKEMQCGPAALAEVLNYSGALVKPDDLVSEVWLPARNGSLQLEMLAAPRRHGRVAYRLEPRYGDLLREVAAGNPVLVLQDVGLMSPLLPEWHYAVANGFDYPTGTIYLRSGVTAREATSFTAFERTWIQGNYWAMVVTRPDRIPVTATEERWLQSLLGLARGGDTEAVVQGYAAALQRWPDSLPAAIGLANALHTRGSLAQAAGVLQDALQRNPQSVIVLNNLAQTLSDLGRHAEALALIERANPDSPFAADVRATRELIEKRMHTPAHAGVR